MFYTLRLCLVILVAGLLSACHSAIKLDPSPADIQSNGASANGTGTETGSTSPLDADPLNDPNGPLAERSIYFAFDSYTVPSNYQALLTAHAAYLKSHPQRHVLLQGNTDERGTSEYNLALGQKRAEAVRRAMSLLGVPDTQMEAVSLGREKPQAQGHDEKSFAKNRRADLVYP